MRNQWIGASLAAISLLVLVVISGCARRDNPVAPGSAPFSRSLQQPFGFRSALEGNPLQDPITRIIRIYTPPDYQERGVGPPMPALYLLHGFGGDGDYFEQYNIPTLLDEMFATDELADKQMIVVTVDASNFFGGSYYTNSVTSGNYADLIGDLVAHIDANFNTAVSLGAAARGISGHGMGGYGAFRAVMANAGMFSSVSSISGPLAFAGDDGQSGIVDWFAKTFEENGMTPPVSEADYRDQLRPGEGKPFSNRVFAMAAAFSGRPARLIDVGECIHVDTFFAKLDTTCTVVDVVLSQVNTTCFIDTVESEQALKFIIRINGQIVDSVTITDTLRSIVQLCDVDTFIISGENAVVPPDPCNVGPMTPFQQMLCFQHKATVPVDGVEFQVDTTVCKVVPIAPVFEYCDIDTIQKEIEECDIDSLFIYDSTVVACTTVTDNMRPTSIPLNVRNDTVVVDLPFNENGELVDSVWSRWLANDVMTLATNNPSLLSGLSIYFEAGDADEFDMDDMSAALDDALSAAHSYSTFGSFDGVPAGHYQLVFKRLQEIIKFHAERLDRP